MEDKRNAMGEYIVPPGEKALTSLGDSLPAPSDYSSKVDITKTSAPHFSIAGRHKPLKVEDTAGPADADTRQNPVWRDKTFALKEKGVTRPYDIRENAHVNDSVGPARYKVEHLASGLNGPRWSVASRHLDGVNAGYPSISVQPVDTHGFETPGCELGPKSGLWEKGPEKSFGIGRKEKTIDGPGPTEYSLSELARGLTYSFGIRLPSPLFWKQGVNRAAPGPGSYELGTTVGKAVKKSISGRHPLPKLEGGPASNLYSLPDEFQKERYAATLNYKRFEPNEGPHPSPTEYTINKVSLEKAPVFSMRALTRPCFPDILKYPLLANKLMTPGPGRYAENRNLTQQLKPKFSMGARAKTPKNDVPGPNKYKLAMPHRPDAKSAPACSVGKRIEQSYETIGPGPSSYYPTSSNNSKAGFSFTKRPKSSKKFITPAANSYDLKQGQNNRGVKKGPMASCKGRMSNWVYSGFRTTKVVD